jgi:hypothetical protein
MHAFAITPLDVALGMSIGLMVGFLAFLLLMWWDHCRTLWRWRREDTRRRQLWDMEDQICLESLPDWQREAMARGRQQRAEVKREARRRLGLPTEEDDG